MKARESFEKEFTGQYRLFAAPGRINLIGEHTDYNEGFVLPASIDKRIYLAIQALDTMRADLVSADLGEKASFLLDDTRPKLPHWALYPFGVVKELQKRGFRPGGFRAAFGGDIPIGSGLSSSAALESAFAVALNALFGLGADQMTLALVGQSAEHHYAGVRCGIMDQFASLFGKKGQVIRLDCRSLAHEFFPLDLEGFELILADTRVKHSLASSAYNERRRQCEAGVAQIRKHFLAVKSLRDVNMEMLAGLENQMEGKVFQRCSYVVEENARVTQTCDALAQGDPDRVGRLMFFSHQGLREQYEVSCPELNLLVETAAKTPGVKGSRMMGGGFGGCTINLVRSNNVQLFQDRIARAFEKDFGHLPLFYQVSTGDGARELTGNEQK